LALLTSSFSGNVKFSSIEGSIVYVELQGACGSCPSSTITMKMGIEKQLKEQIPEITEVKQKLPDVEPPVIDDYNIEVTLRAVRPFLSLLQSDVSLVTYDKTNTLTPWIKLRFSSKADVGQKFTAVEKEITKRLQKYFVNPLLKTEFEYAYI
jgi:hypothetical protein